MTWPPKRPRCDGLDGRCQFPTEHLGICWAPPIDPAAWLPEVDRRNRRRVDL